MKTKRINQASAILLVLALLFAALPSLAVASEAPSVQAENTLRVHYQNAGENYTGLGIWFWGDVATASEKTGAWPVGRTVFPEENISDSGAFLDIALAPAAAQVGLLVIDASGNKDTPQDMMIDIPSPAMKEVWINNALEVFYEDQTMIPEGHFRVRFLRESGDYADMGVWFWGDVVTASEKSGPWPTGAAPMTQAADALGVYADIELAPEAKVLGFLFVNRVSGAQTKDYEFDVSGKARVIYIKDGDDDISLNPYAQAAAAEAETSFTPWGEIDAQYATDSALGAELRDDGTAVLRLWAPTANGVEAVLYAREDQRKILQAGITMQKNADQVWEVTLDEGNTGLKYLSGVFYHFRVIRGESAKLVLDPYAKSMAAWNSANVEGDLVGKAAIIAPKNLGPELAFAQVPGYLDREDAIIYEAHVRDFTSDPFIAEELAAPFGTFAAFKERLDYLKDLGVTHIQLLPVLNYYHVNELDRERSPQYASENENYNWGYDPQSWFALTGMYSTEPNDPEARVREFKELVSLIHEKGMGVILDVVYNHTAKIELLEDIQPNYYYFMDKNGKPKGSYGGGQVGSTHAMTRRLIIDSLAYLTDTYKVDGFRFDMMGSLDSQTVQLAHEKVSQLNPNTLWIGEGWRTFSGDEGVSGVIPADQGWMGSTDAVAVFSDEVRNELKSGFGIEGQPRFITGGGRPIDLIYDNVTAQPRNVSEDDPGDVVQYIEAHDNLTLHDVISLSIKKDPSDHEEEILRRQRLGNALLLTHQGIIFLHSGQEYGRTKQFRHPDFIGPMDTAPSKSTFLTDETGKPFEYPYFIHDSYDASDAVNKFDWDKVQNSPSHKATVDYTRGLIALRRSTDAFSYAIAEDINAQVRRVLSPSIGDTDLLIAFSARSINTGDEYLVIVNADSQVRSLDLSEQALDMDRISVLTDGSRAGTEPITQPQGVQLATDPAQGLLKTVTLDPLTAAILMIRAK